MSGNAMDRGSGAHAMMFVAVILMATAGRAPATDTQARSNAAPPATRLTGLYRLVGDGELCFLPSAQSVAQLPGWQGGSRLCFVNRDALDVLHVRDVFHKVGEPRICGFEGRAAVAVDNLRWVDDHGERRYEATLVDATYRESPTLILCGSP